MRIKEYIDKYGKIVVEDSNNKFCFVCNGSDFIGGMYIKKQKRLF